MHTPNHDVRPFQLSPRRRPRLVAGVCVALAALAGRAAAQDHDKEAPGAKASGPGVTSLTKVVGPDGREAPGGVSSTLSIVRGTHARLVFAKDVERVAVGDGAVASVDLLNGREILVLARSQGRTSLIAWFRDGTIEQFLLASQPDLSVLQTALRDIYPTITVDVAPDRDAVILRGVVPDVSFSLAAESAARDYLGAGKGSRGAAEPLVRAADGGAAKSESPAAPAAGPSEDQLRVAPTTARGATVVNLIRLESLPELSERRIRDAIAPLGGASVRVHRILAGRVPDDATDTLVLEGVVPDQTSLVRIVTLAARVFTGKVVQNGDIRVVADEAGGLSGNAAAGGASQQNSGANSVGSSSGVFAGLGLTSGSSLSLDVGNNVGRAKALSAAGGRVLSFIAVTDLPQVRVGVRVFEVDRTRLRNYSNDFAVLLSDFHQGSLVPATGAVAMQGDAAARVGGAGKTDVQNVLSFLAGQLNEEAQVSGSHAAVSTALSLLASKGLARSLSEPSLTVLSGETASFQVGGEVPVPQAFSPALGGGTTAAGVFSSVQFQQFGVQLDVRPLVGDDDVVTLAVAPSVVEPDAQLTTQIRQTTGTSPATTAFATRSLRTSARVRDGDALVIGGLISRKASADESATPVLSDIPLVGSLFRNQNASGDDLELVVVLTPVVVRDSPGRANAWQYPCLLELLAPPASNPRHDAKLDDPRKAGNSSGRTGN